MGSSDKIIILILLFSGLSLLYCSFTLAREKDTLDLSYRTFTPSPSFFRKILIYLVLLLASFSVTLPTHPPFSPGQQLGNGYLIGGIFALFALLLERRARSLMLAPYPPSYTPSRIQGQKVSLAHTRGLGAFSLALLGTTMVYQLFENNPSDALVGFAFSACLAAFLFPSISTENLFQNPEIPQPISARSPLNFYLLTAIGLPATLLIANVHYEVLGREKPMAEELWKIFPLVIATFSLTTGWLNMIIKKKSPSSLPYLRNLMVPTFSLGLLAGGVWIITQYSFRYPPLFYPFLIGFLSSLLLIGLATEEAKRESPEHGLFRLSFAMISIFLIFFTLLACMIGLGAYGAGLGAVAMLGVLITLGISEDFSPIRFPNLPENSPPSQRTPEAPFSLIFFLVPTFLLTIFFRLFVMEMALSDIRLNLSSLPVHFGLLLGALIPLGLWDLSSLSPETPRGHPTFLLMMRDLILGIMTIMVPLLTWLFWGERATGGVLAGLFFAQCLGALRETFSLQSNRSLNLSAITLGMALVAYQFAPLMLRTEPYLTRSLRIRTALTLLFLGILILTGQTLKKRYIPHKD